MRDLWAEMRVAKAGLCGSRRGRAGLGHLPCPSPQEQAEASGPAAVNWSGWCCVLVKRTRHFTGLDRPARRPLEL